MNETDTKLLDSSVWLGYFYEGRFQKIIDEDTHFLLSSLSIFEIKKKLTQKGLPTREIEQKIGYVKDRSLIIYLSWDITEKAAEISITKNIPMADALIYVSAQKHDATVHTMDGHFRDLPQAVVHT